MTSPPETTSQKRESVVLPGHVSDLQDPHSAPGTMFRASKPSVHARIAVAPCMLALTPAAAATTARARCSRDKLMLRARDLRHSW